MPYAYATDENGTILAVYKGENPQEGYPHHFDEPLDKDAKIIDGKVVLPGEINLNTSSTTIEFTAATISFTAATV